MRWRMVVEVSVPCATYSTLIGFADDHTHSHHGVCHVGQIMSKTVVLTPKQSIKINVKGSKYSMHDNGDTT